MRQIDADALNFEVTDEGEKLDVNKMYIKLGDVIKMIDNVPTIDAEPVRHGMWKPLGQICRDYLVNNYRCSECDQRVHFRTNYCPNCGVKMDGGDE